MKLEFDTKKSILNKEKHGIDFKSAQKLWEDENRVIIPTKNLTEERILLIAKIEQKCWSAIYTIRESKIRIISVRRSRDNEKKIYES